MNDNYDSAMHFLSDAHEHAAAAAESQGSLADFALIIMLLAEAQVHATLAVADLMNGRGAA